MGHKFSNINNLWCTLIVEELVRNGLNYFCISPGSRSTPLTAAAARNSKVEMKIIYDERSSAFHAIGYARATGKPAVVISTSGTAAANFYPAVIEASTDNLPLIILSADRPPELRSAGANQTIDQVKLYGDYVRWQFDFPCPTENVPPETVLTTIDQVVHRAMRNPAGPVHLNCMFREPLAPDRGLISQQYIDRADDLLDSSPGFYQYLKSNAKKSVAEKNRPDNIKDIPGSPYTSYSRPEIVPDEESINLAHATILSSSTGLIAAGRLKNSEEADAVFGLAEALDWPIFADIQSGLRLGVNHKLQIPYYDQYLLSEKFKTMLVPGTVLHFGGQIVSKRFLKLLESGKINRYLHISDNPARIDPAHRITLRIDAGIREFCTGLTARLKNPESFPVLTEHADEENEERTADLKARWIKSYTEHSSRLDRLIEKECGASGTITEPGIARSVSKLISANHALFLASSMPVRDMDMYGTSTGNRVPVGANRGASGIDGTIASAAGFGKGHSTGVTLVTGDLAAIHDSSSFSMLRDEDEHQVIIIIVNNHGGGIFSFLPVAAHEDIFERCFGTPHNFGFSGIAETYNIPYSSRATSTEFEMAYIAALKSGKHAIIEVVTEREQNHKFHLDLQKKITELLT